MLCLDKSATEYLNEGVVTCLDKDDEDNFDADIRNILYYCFEYFLVSHSAE